MREVDTLVVGAGMSGLTFAHARTRREPETELAVLESADRAGGLVRTELEAGFRYEWGPEALTGGEGAMGELLAELDLEPRQPPPEARNRWVVRAGELVPVPMGPGPFLRTPLITLGGKLRALSERWRDPSKALDGSIADFVRHRLGEQVLTALVDPLVSGIHGGDPEQLSVRAAFPQLVEMVERHGSLMGGLKSRRGQPKPTLLKPAGGCEALPRALTAALGSRLHLATPARSLAPDGQRWTVATDGGDWSAAQVVLALPARGAAALLADALPAAAQEIGSLEGENLVSLLHAWPREKVAHPLDGFGYLVPSSEGQVHLGTLFSSTLDSTCAPEGYVLLRSLVGGARHAEVVDWPDERLHQEVLAEVRPLLGLDGDPTWSHLARYRGVLPRYDLDHPRRIRAVRDALPPGLDLLGNWLDGIGVSSLVEKARALAAR